MSKSERHTFKICENPECGKKFYKRSREQPHHWKRRRFCKRFCQSKGYAISKGKQRYSDTSYTSMNDHMTTLLEKTRKIVDKQVIVYSSKNLSQEELRELIPSSKEG